MQFFYLTEMIEKQETTSTKRLLIGPHLQRTHYTTEIRQNVKNKMQQSIQKCTYFLHFNHIPRKVHNFYFHMLTICDLCICFYEKKERKREKRHKSEWASEPVGL